MSMPDPKKWRIQRERKDAAAALGVSCEASRSPLDGLTLEQANLADPAACRHAWKADRREGADPRAQTCHCGATCGRDSAGRIVIYQASYSRN